MKTHIYTIKEEPQELLMLKKETRKLKEMEELMNDSWNEEGQ